MLGTALRVFQLALFGAFLAAPVAWLLVFGPAKPYEQKAQTDFPMLESVVLPEGAGRDQLADAIFERLDLRRMAIDAKNAVFFNALGFVDAPDVVSGEAGWLFYKPELQAWNCEQLEDNRLNLEAVVMLGEISAAARLPFLLTIAPNKASVEQAELQGRAASMAGCYFETEELLEKRLAKENLPTILHHTPLVRARGKSGERYYRTDTHWLPVTGLLAAGDLMRRLGRPGFPEGMMPKTEIRSGPTDLNRMLLLDKEESVPVPDLSVAPAADAIAANRMPGDGVLIVHDSFYAKIQDDLTALLPGVVMAHFENERDKVATAVPEAKRIVASTVERFLFSRVRSDSHLGWLSPTGRWVMDGAESAAEQCLWDQSVDLLTSSPPTLANLSIAPDGAATASTDDPSLETLIPAFPGTATCLRMEVELTQPDVAQVFFSTDNPGKLFLEQRSVRRELGAGAARLQFVAPQSAVGKIMRIDPVSVAGTFKFVRLVAAPAPAVFASVVVTPHAPAAPAAVSTDPLELTLAGPGSLNAFLIVPEKGDTGAVRPDGKAYEARSTNPNRPAVGDGDGVLLRIDAAGARKFSGRKVRVEVNARSSPDRGSPRMRIMYSRSGAPATSGWQELPLTGTFKTVGFEYTVPVAPPASFDFIGFWADPTGKGLGADIASVTIKTIDTPAGLAVPH